MQNIQQKLSTTKKLPLLKDQINRINTQQLSPETLNIIQNLITINGHSILHQFQAIYNKINEDYSFINDNILHLIFISVLVCVTTKSRTSSEFKFFHKVQQDQLICFVHGISPKKRLEYYKCKGDFAFILRMTAQKKQRKYYQKAQIQKLESIKKSIQKEQCDLFVRSKFQKMLDDSKLELTQIKTNFKLQFLCCRTFFFQKELIINPENKQTHFMYLTFPLNPSEAIAKSQQLQLISVVCSFLNSQGGYIYNGFEKTAKDKNKHPIPYVAGQLISQNDKPAVKQAIQTSFQRIFPQEKVPSITIQFIPIRYNPFAHLTLLQQTEAYPYNFCQHHLFANQCSFVPELYVTRVRIPQGQPQDVFSYTSYQDKAYENGTQKCFISSRRGSGVEVRQMPKGQLKTFNRKCLSNGQNRINLRCKIYQQCTKSKPQIGSPKKQKTIGNEIDLNQQQKCLQISPSNLYRCDQIQNNSLKFQQVDIQEHVKIKKLTSNERKQHALIQNLLNNKNDAQVTTLKRMPTKKLFKAQRTNYQLLQIKKKTNKFRSYFPHKT